MKVMSRESENGEEGEISVVKEASHDVRNYVMKLWNGSSGRGIWRWPTFLSFAIDLDFDEQFPQEEGNAATFLRSKWKFMTKTTMDRKERSSRLLRKGRLRDEDYVSSSLLVSSLSLSSPLPFSERRSIRGGGGETSTISRAVERNPLE